MFMKIFSLCSESLLAMLAFTLRYKEKLTHDYVTILLRRRSDSRSPKSDDRTCTNYINLSLYENRHFGETLSMKTLHETQITFSLFSGDCSLFSENPFTEWYNCWITLSKFLPKRVPNYRRSRYKCRAVLNVNISIFTPKTQMKTSHYRKYVSMGK